MSTPKVVASATRQINAVVVSAGLMQKTVKARIGVQKWNNHIKKHFNHTSHLLVHDPVSSLRIGDIISISPGWRYSKRVHHVVNSIVAPFGEPIEERPAVPTLEERMLMREGKREGKEDRRRGKRSGNVGEVGEEGVERKRGNERVRAWVERGGKRWENKRREERAGEHGVGEGEVDTLAEGMKNVL